ncbi:hypothetical protein Ptr902_04041 [Pyrenophora tritici-repentis]|nr:hypothetical protein Ptr902_04041 [Pyrenophora tritici-repentis]
MRALEQPSELEQAFSQEVETNETALPAPSFSFTSNFDSSLDNSDNSSESSSESEDDGSGTSSNGSITLNQGNGQQTATPPTTIPAPPATLSRLPLHIQTQIWTLALPKPRTRILELHTYNTIDHLPRLIYHPPLPSLFSVCRASRSLSITHDGGEIAYANALGRKKLDAALAADNDLRDKINKALDKWRAKQQQSEGSIAIDDGNRPTRPTANTVRYIIQDQEQSALEDNKITQNERVKKMTTCDNRVETNTIADDGLKPKDNLYTAVSMEEDIDKLNAPALSESQVGGEEMEHYNGGLLTPEPSNLSLYNDQDLISEQRAMDEQLAQEQQRNVVQGSQDTSATQIEGYIPDRYENNAPRRRNLDLSTDNIIEGPRRTRRNADLQEPERWHSHAVTYGGSVDNYLKAFSTALKTEPTTKIHCTQS